MVLRCRVLGITGVAEALAIADDVWGPGMPRQENVVLVREGLTELEFGP